VGNSRKKRVYLIDLFVRAEAICPVHTLPQLVRLAQTAVCNRHHSVDQQLCRWLLLSFDQVPGNELTMTQELIANTLGVRREGVTVNGIRSAAAAGTLTLSPPAFAVCTLAHRATRGGCGYLTRPPPVSSFRKGLAVSESRWLATASFFPQGGESSRRRIC
jgi:hypothetical protein